MMAQLRARISRRAGNAFVCFLLVLFTAGFVQADTAVQPFGALAGLADASGHCGLSLDEISRLRNDIAVGAVAEWDQAKDVIVHTPGEEIFLGLIHPDAALFEQPFALAGAQREHDAFICLLRQSGARVFRLKDILLAGTVDQEGRMIPGPELDALRAFAEQFLIYDASGLPADKQALQAQYKEAVLAQLHPRELVKIIFQQPTVKLTSTGDLNTGYVASYTLNPVMNLYFMRDQVMTTAKGLVLGRFNAEQRRIETDIARFAYEKLGIEPIVVIEGEGTLEGGDFIPAGDVAFQGQGLRTNAQAISQMLASGAYGSKRVVVVKDPWENQIQMHLDTYFNVVRDKLAAMVEDRMDIRDSAGHIIKPADPNKRPMADIYELQGASYELVEQDIPFQTVLEERLGYTVIPVSQEDQLNYGLNFLTTSENRILAIDGVSQDLKDRFQDAGIDALWMDFRNLTSGYGAAHCTTQVILRGS
jgi:arginine deiminase